MLILAQIALLAFLSDSWGKERQVLLERIQRPERVFIEPQRDDPELLEKDDAELAKVGAIDYGDEA